MVTLPKLNENSAFFLVLVNVAAIFENNLFWPLLAILTKLIENSVFFLVLVNVAAIDQHKVFLLVWASVAKLVETCPFLNKCGLNFSKTVCLGCISAILQNVKDNGGIWYFLVNVV